MTPREEQAEEIDQPGRRLGRHLVHRIQRDAKKKANAEVLERLKAVARSRYPGLSEQEIEYEAFEAVLRAGAIR